MPDCWARCQFYEPFTMGGEVWQNVRFPVKGKVKKDLLAGEQVFVVETPAGDHYVYHLETGGWLAGMRTEKAALKQAKEGIEMTPDFKEQVKKLGSVMDLNEVSAEEAWKRLLKNKAK